MIISIAAFSCASSQPLEIKIDYPLDGSTLRTNLVKITGEVSNPAAMLTINGIDITASQNGSFNQYLQLSEGDNEIKVSAISNGETIEKTIKVMFIPEVSIYLQSREVTGTYIIVDGFVFPPQAAVEVNGIPVMVDTQGVFSVKIGLSEGNNIIEAIATYSGSEDTDAMTVQIQNGQPTFPPPVVYNQTRVVCDSQISVIAGQSVVLVITESAGKEVQPLEEHQFRFTPVSEEYGIDAVPLPDGMSLNITPSKINVYPNTSYQIEMTVQTSKDVQTGNYWIMVYEENNSGNPNFRGWVKIVVTNHATSSGLSSASIPTQTPWLKAKVYTDAGQPIIVNTGDNFIVGFMMNYNLYPVIKEIYDDSMVTLLDNTFAITDDKNQAPVYRWFLFKGLKTGETQITIKQCSHLVETLENQKIFTVILQ